jgi:glycosyltransferase involved in cell wall biosynthesis
LEAFYRADTADFSMILIGSTETGYTKRLYQLQKKYEAVYGEKNVSILYGVEREKIHEYVRDATIFVMSSTWEQYSIALCEAMAEGVPFISTDVGNASFLPGGVIANTVDEIATAMTTLLSNLDAAKKLGLRGKEYAYAHNKREVAIQSLIEVIEQERRNKKR